MKAYKAVAVKICGITRQEDATFAVKSGVELLGFIFHPKSPRYMTPEAVAAIETQGAMRVGVFVDQSLEEVQAIMKTAKLHLAQLHADQDVEFCKALGKQQVMRAFWPERYSNAMALQEEMERFAPYCRFFLLDAGSSGGGHGKLMDLSILSQFKSPKPYFLAGGLGPDTLPEVMRVVMPCGVDLNSGVEESPGVKDHKLIEKALQAVMVKRSLGD